MTPEPAGRRVERYAVSLPSGASLSFQRYLLGETETFDVQPRSLGGLPCAETAGGVMVPLPDREGLWIACLPPLQAGRVTLTVRPDIAPARTTRVAAPAGATLLAVPGLQRGRSGFSPIRRTAPEQVLRLTLESILARAEARTEELALTLVDPDRFEAATGFRLATADPRHGFGGWRLP